MSFLRSILIVALAGGGCVAGRAEGTDPEFRERLLGVIPEGVRVTVPAVFSQDGRHAAWVEQNGEACRAVRGAWRGKPYDVVC